jgi:4,5:9,10-diseco-3-hydroxy-5,9,17-trioxoandrosta-1(10),2-diene-4-oate hydrolase
MIELPGESRHVVRVGGINTHYVVAGDGRPLLLFHGLGASVVTWRDNIGPLSKAFRVYAVDLPGHGDSDKPDIDYATDTMVQFVKDFIESLNLERPAIIGSSVGGALALMTALRHPDLVSGLVLVDSASLGRELSLYIRLVSIPWLGEFLESSRVGGTKFMLYKVFHDPEFVTQELREELHRSRNMPGAKEAVVRVIRNAVNLMGIRKQYVLVSELNRLAAPMMVVWGAQDQIIPVSHAYRASEAVPDARLHVFDQCGHWSHMEKASEFNSLAMDFLSS